MISVVTDYLISSPVNLQVPQLPSGQVGNFQIPDDVPLMHGPSEISIKNRSDIKISTKLLVLIKYSQPNQINSMVLTFISAKNSTPCHKVI